MGKDEFDRREFEQVRANKVAEIKGTVMHVRVDSAFGAILDYDFEHKCFPAYLILSVLQNSTLRLRCDGYRPHARAPDYQDAVISVSNLEEAKGIRSKGPFSAALVIAKPIGATKRSSDEKVIVIKILGLRLFAERDHEQLLNLRQGG